jgi:hypothetical protein
MHDLHADMHAYLYPGISWRWSLVAEDDQLQLQLQGLPHHGRHLKSVADYSNDDLAVIQLATYPIEGQVFDGDLAAGPVPIFFSSKPEDTLKRLKSID